MKKWKKRALVSLIAVILGFETMPMNVFATEVKTSLAVEESTDFSLNTMSVSENEGAKESTREITKENTETEQMALPIVTSGESVRTGTLGDNNGIHWSYDENTKTLTVTGEDSGLQGNYASGSLFNSICSDVESIVFENCILKGSLANAFEYLDSLKSVQFINADTSNVTNMDSIFKFCSRLTSLDLSGFDTSKVTDMDYMFYGCSSLASLDLSGFDTSNLTDMSGMFKGCSSLTSLDVSGFDTSSVSHMGSLFYGCSSLVSLDLSGFDTSNVTSLAGMFTDCSSLVSLDLSGFDTSNVRYTNIMFQGCNNLSTIHTPNMMATGQIIVVPNIFYDADGNRITELTSATCNMVLSRVIAAPSFGVKGIINGRDVTFNCDIENAVIYYSTTTSNLTLEDKHVNVGETVTFSSFYGTIYAKAYINGAWSNASRLVLKIPVVNKPAITQSDSSVTIKTTTPNCTIYYTTDGSTPTTTNGTKVNASTCTIPTVSGTVKAIAVRNCFTNSDVASQSFVTNAVATPSFGVVGMIGGRKVTFNNQTPGSKIYYSTSSTMTISDNCVNNGGSVTFERFYGTIYARTYHNGKWSNVAKLILKIPTINTPAVEDVSGGRVKLKTTTPGCAIYYTTDGSTPSPTNGRKANSSSTTVYVGNGKTVKAIAVRSCFTNSAVATGRTR